MARSLPELLKLPDDALVSAGEASAVLDTPEKTLDWWRCKRRGPAFVKLGENVRYRMGDLRAFQKAGRVDHAA